MDVYTDLATILPQLDEAVDGLAAGQPAELAFYEQGVERTVFCTPSADGDTVVLRCVSYGNWVPPQPDETAGRTALLAMLRQFRRDVATEVRAFWPELAALPPFPAWLDDRPA